jgi:hypothetical protein
MAIGAPIAERSTFAFVSIPLPSILFFAPAAETVVAVTIIAHEVSPRAMASRPGAAGLGGARDPGLETKRARRSFRTRPAILSRNEGGQTGLNRVA